MALTDNFIYALGRNSVAQHSLVKIELTGLTITVSGTPETYNTAVEYMQLCVDDTHLYVAGNRYPSPTIVKRYLKSDLSYVDSSPTLSEGSNTYNVGDIITDTTYVYVGMTMGKVKRLLRSDLSYVDEVSGMGFIKNLLINDGYLYVCSELGINKLNLSDLSVAKSNLGDYFQNITIIGDYLYGSKYVNTFTNYILKFNKYDLSYVSSSGNIGGVGFTISGNDSHVFLTINYRNGVKYDTDLVYAAGSPYYQPWDAHQHGARHGALDDNYFYMGGDGNDTNPTAPIKRYRISDLTYIDSSPDLDGAIYDFVIDGSAPEAPDAPSGLTATNITLTSMDLSWVNNALSGDSVVVQSYTGGTWNDVAILATGATTYSYTGLTKATDYILRVSARYLGIDNPSNSITPRTLSDLYAGEIQGDQNTCFNEAVTGITTSISPSGGTTPYSYQWQSGTTVGDWADMIGETGTTLSLSEVFTTTHYFRKSVIDADTTTGYTNTVTKTVYSLWAGEIGSNQTILNGEVPDELTEIQAVTGDSGSISYTWQYTTDTGSTWTNAPSGYTVNYQPSATYDTTYWRRKAYDYYCFSTEYSNILKIFVDEPHAPSGLTISNKTCEGFDLTWVNNGDFQGDIVVKWLDESILTWVTYDTYPTGTTGMTFTGLTYDQGIYDTPYTVRVSNVYDTYYYTSDNLGNLNPALPAVPTDFKAEFLSGSCTDVQFTWTNPSCYEVIHLQKQTGSGNVDIATFTTGDTSYVLSGLTVPVSDSYQIVNEYGITFYVSSPITVNTPFECNDVPNFCASENPYNVVDATCGERDGEIIIDAIFAPKYDFYLVDPFGASYTLYTDRWYVTAGWYALYASPKQAYWSEVGRDTCEFKWIKVNNSDTTMTSDRISIKDSSCNVFGGGKGRLGFFNTDSYAGTDYDVYLFNEAGSIVSQTNLTDISEIIFSPLNAGRYYLMILNNSSANGGCRLLIGVNVIKNFNNFSVAGIKKIWITEWNKLVEYNYWTAADEEYYLSGVDSDFFSSIKIKEFVDSTLPTAWFEIIMDTKAAQFSQVMNKTKQGFIFTDSLTLTIPHADNTKWKQLTQFLTERYIVVFQDNNNQFWVMGYRLGTTTDSYKRSNNEYILTLNAVSDNKILTNLNEDYVINNIINS